MLHCHLHDTRQLVFLFYAVYKENFLLCQQVYKRYRILLGYIKWRLGNCNPGQNIWNKIEKPSKTGQVKKIFISTFMCFLTAIAKVWFLGGRLGAGLYVSAQIWDVPNYSLFPKMLSHSATCEAIRILSLL